MSEWAVIADHIEIFPHPNAEKMSLGRVGTFQVVCGKNEHQNGDLVVFAPKRSILPIELRKYYCNTDTGHSYLKGPNADRVGSIRLRGEESEGVILPSEWLKQFKDKIVVGQDLSKVLGIEEYIPEIHSVSGKRKSTGDQYAVQNVSEVVDMERFVRHDVEHFRIFEKEFVQGEHVILTEKLHGSSVNVVKDRNGNIAVTSKGKAEKNLVLREYPKIPWWHGRTFSKKIVNLIKKVFRVNKPEMNEYWRVARDSGIIEFLNLPGFKDQEIQIIGEVVPFQNGFSYGYAKPTVKVFRMIFNTQEMPYGTGSPDLDWVPLLYEGPYELDKILPLARGKETVSGKQLHIREGGVLSPVPLRKVNHTPLLVKLINKDFKDNNEDIR